MHARLKPLSVKLGAKFFTKPVCGNPRLSFQLNPAQPMMTQLLQKLFHPLQDFLMSFFQAMLNFCSIETGLSARKSFWAKTAVKPR